MLIFHSLDVKPDNVLLNWNVDDTERFRVDKVQLGDMDCAFKLEGQNLLNHKIGNVMWRSPEGQLGKGYRKAFGGLLLWTYGKCTYYVSSSDSLTVISSVYISSRAQYSISQTIKIRKLNPRPQFCSSCFRTSAPYLPDALLKHVNDGKGEALLKDLWEYRVANGLPGGYEPFERWSEEIISDEAKRLILRMTNLDSAKRASMEDIVMDSY